MQQLITLALAVAAAVIGFIGARGFVRDRLRFVDAVQRRAAPWVAGGVAALVALPAVALLPLVGTGTAILFGVSVGAGVASGARDIRNGTSGYLTDGSQD